MLFYLCTYLFFAIYCFIFNARQRMDVGGKCSRLSCVGLWLSHCSPGAEQAWCSRGARLEQGPGPANGISAGLGCTSRLSVSEHQLKLCSWYGTGAGLGALMVNLAWDERDWLPRGCGCSHQCHRCCHWQGAQLVLCHIQLFIDPHPPCRKTAVAVQWHKGGSRRSRSQPRSLGKHSSGAAPGHSHCQSVL